MKKLLRFYVEPVVYIFAFRSTASHNMQLSNHSYRYTDWLGTKSYVPKAYVGLRTEANRQLAAVLRHHALNCRTAA